MSNRSNCPLHDNTRHCPLIKSPWRRQADQSRSQHYRQPISPQLNARLDQLPNSQPYPPYRRAEIHSAQSPLYCVIVDWYGNLRFRAKYTNESKPESEQISNLLTKQLRIPEAACRTVQACFSLQSSDRPSALSLLALLLSRVASPTDRRAERFSYSPSRGSHVQTLSCLIYLSPLIYNINSLQISSLDFDDN